MRLPQLPSTSHMASSVLAGLLATGVWLPCQPPAQASALVRDGGSTLCLAVAVAPGAATLPAPGLGAAAQLPAVRHLCAGVDEAALLEHALRAALCQR